MIPMELVSDCLSKFTLRPHSFETYKTARGSIEIKTIVVHFPLYLGRLKDTNLPKTYKSKPLVVIEGEVLYGELAILRCLEQAGFRGVWVDTFHGRGRKKVLWTGMPPDAPQSSLDEDADRLYNRILEKNLTKKGRQTSGGFFDVFAWKDGEYVFLEYKGVGDKVRPTQLRWIDAVVSNKIAKPEQLFFVRNQAMPTD